MLGHIHSEESFGALDGPGIRYVVFLQGCMLRCKYCHNPDSWDMRCGKTIDSDELLGRILECRSFITGVTLSGGEPLLQPDFCAEIISRCKKNGLHTAVDTSGAVPLKKCSAVIDLADLVLLDIKALDDELCRELTGHSNEHELKLLSYCESTDKPVWIRHVLLQIGRAHV